MGDRMITLLNIDCMDYMATCKDKQFDLAIVDPGYGIGEDWNKSKSDVHYKHISIYKNNKIPCRKYFKELFRISKNQIIWGGNYFTRFLRPTNRWIIWDKHRDVEKTFMSEAEVAWTSFKIPMRIFRYQWDGGKKQSETGIKKIHPHQKPLALYKWLLKNYAKEGDRIIDTHLGSGSSAIAAYDFGCDFVGTEIDLEYFNAAVARFENHKKQLRLYPATSDQPQHGKDDINIGDFQDGLLF